MCTVPKVFSNVHAAASTTNSILICQHIEEGEYILVNILPVQIVKFIHNFIFVVEQRVVFSSWEGS